jgi:predicted DCC family thiol-disulfide oxidoreductase YuxK
LSGEQLTVFIDTDCAMCTATARWIARNDPHSVLRILSLHSPEAAAALAKANRPELAGCKRTLVFEEKENVWFKSTAVLRILAHLRAPWCHARHLLVLPEGLRDAVYEFVARNRQTISRWLFARRNAR